VQIDEPYMQARPEKAREYGLRALNRALARASPGTTCRGTSASAYGDHPPGARRVLVPPELAGCPCRQVSVETAQSKLDCAVLGKLEGKQIMVGCLDLDDKDGRDAGDGGRAPSSAR